MQCGNGAHRCGVEWVQFVDAFDVSMVSTWVFAFNPAPIALGKAAIWQIGRWWLVRWQYAIGPHRLRP